MSYIEKKLSKDTSEHKWLLFLAGCCMFIYMGRILYSGTLHYFFMPWNLFLGFVPLFFSRLLRQYPAVSKSNFLLLLVACLWLLFFPNAPYMLTDLFHLRSRVGMPMWYDLLFILSFAWTGLMAGFVSLWDIEQLVLRKNIMDEKYIPRISGALLFVASFGIYLGRYLRWNSWDLFVQPFPLMKDIADRFLHPFHHPETWGMTLLMGFFLNVLYHSLRMIRKQQG
jgi:uncharacterized membrane protein